LLLKDQGIISTQVLSELSNLLSKKFRFKWPDIATVHDNLTQNLAVHIVSPSTIHKAISLAERFKFSYYDTLILSAAIEASCSILYSEDFQHNQVIEGVRIINPFL
jgi:predicted nucleic acid-binding protein